jgi:sialic acid synthase SpsE
MEKRQLKEIKIKGRAIGQEHPVFIVAEIGSNHCRDKKVVKKLIDTVSVAGFDAVKFQTYDPEQVFSGKITTRDVDHEEMYGFKPWWDIARDHVLLPRDWFGEMFSYARDKNLFVFSTAHSVDDVEFLMSFDPPMFKVASLDVSHLDFLEALATYQKPILLSTGMHYLGEIERAVETIIQAGNDQILLLHCVSNYPPAPEDMNLRNIPMLHKTFDTPVGLSDHSSDNYAAMAGIALGACVVEKHVTLDRRFKGPDHSFALDPDGMKDLVKGIRTVEKGLGACPRNLSKAELATRTLARRSIVAKALIARGDVFTRDNLKLSRPGSGLHPKHLKFLLGRKAKINIGKEDLVTWEMVD